MERPSAEYLALERNTSDHSPLVLKTVSRNFRPKPFRFFNSWLGREEFADMVRKSIEAGVFMGNPDTKLMMKFKWLRYNISSWASECKVKEKEEKSMLDHELRELDEAMEIREISEEELWTLEETKRRLRDLEAFHQRDLKQKSRSN